MNSLNPEVQDRIGLRTLSNISNFCSVYGDIVKWQTKGEVKILLFLEIFLLELRSSAGGLFYK